MPATYELLNNIIRGIRRGGLNSGSDFPIAVNENNDQMVAQGMPPYADLTRRGVRFKVATATPFTPEVVLPTTVAKLEVKNQFLNQVLVIDTIWSWQLLGTAVVWSHTPWAQVGAPVVAADTALVVYYSNKVSPVASAAGTQLRTAINQTVVANGWECFPGSTMNFGLAAATPGGANVGQVDGRLIVPPSLSVHLTVTASVATASSIHCGVSGYVLPITND